MKKFIFPFLLLVLLLSVFPFLDNSRDTKIYTGLPWQIEILPDGSTKVFGLHIGKSTLTDALGILGEDMELAVIAAPDEAGNLEMYGQRFEAFPWTDGPGEVRFLGEERTEVQRLCLVALSRVCQQVFEFCTRRVGS